MATKTAPTKAQILAWAAKSTRPNGDCQGFAGNDFTSHFGSFTTGYYSAKTAREASMALGHFHKGHPPNDGRVYWVFFDFPTFNHIMLYIDGVMIGDSSHCSRFLNKKKTIGTMKLEDYPKQYKYLGYSSSNGKNTVPAPPKIQKNLSTAEVKKVATFLNSKKLGKTTTASTTGINVLDGSISSNYYWEIQKYSKEKTTGIPTSTTYSNEKKILALLTHVVPDPPVVTPPVVTPPEETGGLTLTEAQVELLNTAWKTLGSLLNK